MHTSLLKDYFRLPRQGAIPRGVLKSATSRSLVTSIERLRASELVPSVGLRASDIPEQTRDRASRLSWGRSRPQSRAAREPFSRVPEPEFRSCRTTFIAPGKGERQD